MEHIPDNPIDVNADLAPTLTARQAEFITFLCRSKGNLEALQQHFELGALELVEFFSSKLCKAKLDGLLDNLNVVLQIAATQVQHIAMHHLQNVCEKLESQPDMIEKLRLSASALGRLASATRPPRASTPRNTAKPASKPVAAPTEGDSTASVETRESAESSTQPTRGGNSQHTHYNAGHTSAAPDPAMRENAPRSDARPDD